MYFESRSQAGQYLAQALVAKYRYENCAVLALSPGSVLVGEQIAAQLHSPLMMMISEQIEIPGEGVSIGAVSQSGALTYNREFTQSEIDGYSGEYQGYFNEKKREAASKINRLIGDGGSIDFDLLRDRVVILVSDGLYDTTTLDVTFDLLKPVRTQKIIVALPLATVAVVDYLHISVDELHILDVKENFLGVDHYYSDNTLPTVEQAVQKISQIILNWR